MVHFPNILNPSFIQFSKTRMFPVRLRNRIIFGCGIVCYRATVSNFNGELVYSELFGWNYQASWSEGSYSFLMRFQLIQNGEKLRLLEVGSYQTCICEGCTGLSFHKNIPGCNSDGAPAEFLMGETLH